MSPSKKANKKVSSKKTKNAQSTSSARSSRVQRPAKKTKTAQTKNSARSTRAKKQVRRVQQARASAQVTALPVGVSATPSAADASKGSSFQTNVFRVLALIAVIVITIYVISIRERVEEFKEFGYIGIFFIALLANATVFIPAPGVAIIYAMGAIFPPLSVGIVAGTGGAIGELSGYLAGFSGQAIVEQTDVYARIKLWVEKYGGWAILILSAIPNPLFDVAGFAAGIAKMPMRTFLFSVWIGQLIKMTMFAYAGRFSLDWIAKFLN